MRKKLSVGIYRKNFLQTPIERKKENLLSTYIEKEILPLSLYIEEKNVPSRETV